jgi:hypothetical protein
MDDDDDDDDSLPPDTNATLTKPLEQWEGTLDLTDNGSLDYTGLSTDNYSLFDAYHQFPLLIDWHGNSTGNLVGCGQWWGIVANNENVAVDMTITAASRPNSGDI